MCSNQVRSGVMLQLLECEVSTQTIWNTCAWKICLFSPFTYPITYFISSWIFILYFGLILNTTLFYCSNYSDFGQRESFPFILMSL
jgi:hypothetical protein